MYGCHSVADFIKPHTPLLRGESRAETIPLYMTNTMYTWASLTNF